MIHFVVTYEYLNYWGLEKDLQYFNTVPMTGMQFYFGYGSSASSISIPRAGSK